ncbi:MAG: universal stress protein [Nitratireductor sp.]|nr:universal stress protein [Nitratireductor sp.]
MDPKTVVAVIRGEEDLQRVVRAAAGVAGIDKGHVIGTHSEPSPAAYVPAIGMEGIPYDTGIAEANRKRMAELGESFEKACEGELVSGEWRGFESFSGDSAINAITSAFSADIVVAQQADPDHPESGEINLEALLFETGRPVLMIPYTWTPPLKMDRIIIAWNGKKEAARAVFDALPFLKKAKSVEILLIDPQENDEHSAAMAGADIAVSLERHGIKAEVVNQPSGGIPVGEAIENRISETGADMLVMGAYSRSRVSEMLFGGATRTMLSSMMVPVLMSR